MQDKNKLKLLVFGVPIRINYAEAKVDYPTNLTKGQLDKIIVYIGNEGWLDKEFAELFRNSE
jgi:hypothetical protein